MGCNMVKSSSPNVPSTSVIFLCLRTHTSPQTCHHSASSILTVQISCCIIAMFVCRKQQEEWSRRIPTIGLAYFLTKLPYYNLCTGMYVCMIFIVKCVTITHFFHCLCSASIEKHDFYCSAIPWNCTWYCTVQVLYFFIAVSSLED